MSKLNEKGLLFLSRVILNLAETVGKEKAIEVIQKDPGLYIDLLSEDHFQDNYSVPLNLIRKKWSLEDIEKLKLTKLQTAILETIIANKNEATLELLEKELFNQGIEVSNGSMIGGSLAGISKKCESAKLPQIYKSVHGSDGITYSIIPEAKKIIQNFLH